MDETPNSLNHVSRFLPEKMSGYFRKNREALKSTESTKGGFNNKPSLMRSAGTHLSFECNGTTFVYAYIRKNACSAFKDFICATSPYLRESESDFNRLKFLRTHHEIHNINDFSAAGVRIFVYRNPIERATSLFKNKFIMSSGNADVFHDYERVTGKNPIDATFSDFVNNYLAIGVCALDPHCRTQQSHLLPMQYTHAINMKNLHKTISPLIGNTLAKKYFAYHVNSSTARPCSQESANVSASKLHEAYLIDKRIPTSDALLTLDLTRTLRRIYRDDYRMLSSIERAGEGYTSGVEP